MTAHWKMRIKNSLKLVELKRLICDLSYTKLVAEQTNLKLC
jgi:hypothetical protein